MWIEILVPSSLLVIQNSFKPKEALRVQCSIILHYKGRRRDNKERWPKCNGDTQPSQNLGKRHIDFAWTRARPPYLKKLQVQMRQICWYRFNNKPEKLRGLNSTLSTLLCQHHSVRWHAPLRNSPPIYDITRVREYACQLLWFSIIVCSFHKTWYEHRATKHINE